MGEGADFYVRFVGKDKRTLVGECMDELHPGKEYPEPLAKDYMDKEVVFGWFEFSDLSFSFSAKETKAKEDAAAEREKKKAPPGQPQKPAPPAKAKSATEDDNPYFNTPHVSLSKRVNSASRDLWLECCYKGQQIKRVEVEACRTGGLPGAPKLPFVRLIFEDAFVEEISMSLPEGEPEESLSFSYKKVQMESIWTDNETGKRRVDQPRRFGWDFTENYGWSADR
jgi:type VI protein secretion system component Hcp